MKGCASGPEEPSSGPLGLVGLGAQARGCLDWSPAADPDQTHPDQIWGCLNAEFGFSPIAQAWWRAGGLEEPLWEHMALIPWCWGHSWGLLYRDPLPGAKTNDAVGFTDPDS